MRTALVLLFLLAIASIPGALLPQWQLNRTKTQDYINSHGVIGQWLNRLQLFSVFSSSWFTAIYVLLLVSLVGCILPRSFDHYRQWKQKPPAAPKNFNRLTDHQSFIVSGTTPADLKDHFNTKLKGWRKEVRTVDGNVEFSAERGYIRELGNLIFHISLVVLLVTYACGKLWGYEGIRIITADDNQSLCTSTPSVFDSFYAGGMINGTSMIPLCLDIGKFKATYLPTGEASNYELNIKYQTKSMIKNNQWKDDTVSVNHPLRTSGDRVYLLGHGYAPTFTLTWPKSKNDPTLTDLSRTQTNQFEPENQMSFLSQGVLRFDPPGGIYSESEQTKHQIAIEGIFAPTGTVAHNLLASTFPAPLHPMVAIDIYVGNSGLNTGQPQNVYQLDRNLINSGQLKRVDRVNMVVGQSVTLNNGVIVKFDGYKQWVAIQVSHTPLQLLLALAALGILVGLTTSLTITRRRIWVRIYDNSDSGKVNNGIRVDFAGLTRTDSSRWSEDFKKKVKNFMPNNVSYSEMPEHSGDKNR